MISIDYDSFFPELNRWSQINLAVKANGAFGLLGSFQHLLNRRKHDLKSGVVPLLHLLDFAAKARVRCEHLSQANEGSHYGDVNLYGSLATQDAGKHGDALLSEGIRSISPPTPALTF